jgi:hypothetical protein
MDKDITTLSRDINAKCIFDQGQIAMSGPGHHGH